jgi:WD40 repeat protein
LLSRLAAQGGETGYATQASLRSALQNLRLQVKLQGHQGPVRQVQFSPDYRYLGTAGADGTVRLWSVDAQTIYNSDLQATKVLHWTESAPNQVSSQAQPARQQSAIQAIRFSPDGRQIAAIAQGSSEVKIWAVETGAVVAQIAGTDAIKQISFSATGEWLATLDTVGIVSLWNTGTGELKAQLPQRAVDLQIGADNTLLTAGEDGAAQLWQLGLAESGQLAPKLVKTLTHPDVVHQAKFSPSGRWINTLSKDGQVRVWDRQTGQLQRSLLNSVSSLLPEGAKAAEATQLSAHPSAIQQMELSPDEQTLATTDANHQVWLWNTQSGQLHAKLGGDQPSETPSLETPSLETPIPALANHSAGTDLVQFSPTGEMVVTTGASGNSDEFYSAYLWNRQTGTRIGKLSGHQGKITSVQFSPDGTYIVTASADGAVRLWSAELGGELPSVQLPGQLSSETATWISLFPGGTTQSINSDTSSAPSSSATQPSPLPVRQITNWELPDLTQAQAARANTSVTKMVAVDPTGRLRQWRILTQVAPSRHGPTLPQRYTAAIQSQNAASNLRYQLMSLLPFRSFETSKSLTPGFAQLLQSLTSKMLPPSPVSESAPNLDLSETTAALTSFAISSDEQLLAKADIKGRIAVYKNRAGAAPQLLYQIDNWRSDQRSDQANATTLSQVVTTTSTDQANANQQTLNGTPTPIHHLVFSPDSQQLLGVADDLTMRTWDARSGQALKVFRGHEAAIRQARYSADGQWVISASWDKTARIWRADTAELSKVLPHEDAVSSASFSPNGQQIVTASWDGTTQIWQTDAGKPQFLLRKHQKSVVDAQFSPDGSLVVTASTDGTARLWKADSGEEQALLSANSTGEPEALMQAFFSPDGQYVATLSKSGRINLWAATWDMLLNLARQRSLRQLTPDECRRYLKLSPEQCPQLPS